MVVEEIIGVEVVVLECIRNFSREFKREHKNLLKPFMGPGWKTWTTPMFLENSEDGLLILEDNEYEINFPRDHFRIVD